MDVITPELSRRDKFYARKKCRQIMPATQCSTCGDTESLHRHHRDGNPINNSPENIQILCRRCHVAEHKGKSNYPKHRRKPGEVLTAICVVCNIEFVCGKHARPGMMPKVCSKPCNKIWTGINSSRMHENMSPEHRAKLSASIAQGHYRTGNAIPCWVLTPKGEVLYFPSATKAGSTLGINNGSPNQSRRSEGRIKSHGYRFASSREALLPYTNQNLSSTLAPVTLS